MILIIKIKPLQGLSLLCLFLSALHFISSERRATLGVFRGQADTDRACGGMKGRQLHQSKNVNARVSLKMMVTCRTEYTIILWVGAKLVNIPDSTATIRSVGPSRDVPPYRQQPAMHTPLRFRREDIHW